MSNRRFYDNNPALTEMVNTFLGFPAEIQNLIADGFSQLAQRFYQDKEQTGSLKTVGSELILAFHKSKRKQREYDQSPQTHQALNDLMLIGEDKQLFMAHKTIRFMGLVHEYLDLCRNIGLKPQETVLEAMKELYVNKEISAVAAYMEAIHQQFKGAIPIKRQKDESPLQSKGAKAPPPSSENESVRSEAQGMKIKGDILKL